MRDGPPPPAPAPDPEVSCLPGHLRHLSSLCPPCTHVQTQFSKPSLPWLPFALRLKLSSSAVCEKLLALVTPCFIAPSPCLHSNCSPANSVPSCGYLCVEFPAAAFPPLHLCSPAHPSAQLICPGPQSSLPWGSCPAAAQDQTLLWAFRIVFCPPEPPVRSVV